MSKSLQDVDDELAVLERQMAEAMERRKQQAQQQAQQASQVPQTQQRPVTTESPPRTPTAPPKPTSQSDASSITAADLQRQIEELERELEQAKTTPKPTTTTTTTTAPTAQPTTSTAVSPPTIPTTSTSAPVAASPHQRSTKIPSFTTPPVQQSPAEDDPIRLAAQQKYSFEKPAWAIPTEEIGGDQSILSEPINNNLKKPSTGGYERKVFDKDLEIIKGTFKKATAHEKLPDPRLVWIVININGSKVGKIAMHLYGNCDGIVDKFLELKGLEIKRESNDIFVVKDIIPNFYITNDKTIPTTYKIEGSSTNVYGYIFEGHDVYQIMCQSPPADTLYTIKQSHIFPIKKTKM